MKRANDGYAFHEWRNANYKCFTSQSKVTPESTKLWIESKRFKEKLYGVYDGDRIVGHFTLSSKNELGAVLKDPNYKKPIMRKAILSIIKNKKTWLVVLANNQKAIEFYKKLGFKKMGVEKHNELLHFRMERNG